MVTEWVEHLVETKALNSGLTTALLKVYWWADMWVTMTALKMAEKLAQKMVALLV